MAAPTVQSFAVTEVNASSGDPGQPAGLAVSDLVLLFLHCDGNRTPTWPTGFAQLYDDNAPAGDATHAAAWKIWAAGDSTNVSWGVTEKAVVGAVRITGFDSADPIDTVGLENDGTSTTPQCPSVTTTVADTLVIRSYATDGSSLATEDADYPAGTTGLYNRETSGGVDAGGGVAHEVQATAGATGIADWSLDISNQWSARTIVIKPTSGAGPALAPAAILAL